MNILNFNKVERLHILINKHHYNVTSLIKNIEVLKWIENFDEFVTPFLDERKGKKISTEKIWGQSVMNTVKSWSGIMGERIVKEIFSILDDKVPCKPNPINGTQPDLITEKYIVEVKTRTYGTTGTAGEKIWAVPFKYAHIPRLYGKPLLIVCVGYQEVELKKIREKLSTEQRDLLEVYKAMNIFFIGATELLDLVLEKKIKIKIKLKVLERENISEDVIEKVLIKADDIKADDIKADDIKADDIKIKKRV